MSPRIHTLTLFFHPFLHLFWLSIPIYLVTCIQENIAKALPIQPTALTTTTYALKQQLKAQDFYRKRHSLERPVAGWQSIPTGLKTLSAKECGVCHSAIYAEWQVSTHAFAWRDRQFQEEIKKSGNRWLCNNCHTPLMNQMENWVTHLTSDDVEKPNYVQNPRFDPKFRDEGITCAACHVRKGIIEGPTGIKNDAHVTKKAPRFNSEEICLRCHQAIRDYPEKSFACTFNTGEEWQQSRFGKTKRPCQYCHMPANHRPQAKGVKPRNGRSHYFAGAGVYKEPNLGPPLTALWPGINITVKHKNKTKHLQLTLTNTAGHSVPTGDPERFILITVMFLDDHGEEVARQSIRLGQQWQWTPTPIKISDNRLQPDEMRDIHVTIPRQAIRWRLVASHHRISQEAHDYHRLGNYPMKRVFFKNSGDLTPPSQ